MVALPRPPQSARQHRSTLRKVLLGCGVVSSVLYVAADIVGTLRYPGYHWTEQQFSELTAQGAPTRPLMIGLVEFPYNLLVLAFAAALWTTVSPKRRAARLAAAALLGYTSFGFVAGTITPMATREAMAAGQDIARNAYHGPLTLVSDLFLALAMVFAGQLLGKRFRYYSYATVATLIVFGVLTSLQIPQMQHDEPTPWMGIEERINIYGSMLWFAVLALGLLRAEARQAPPQLGRPTVNPRTKPANRGKVPA